MFEEATTPYTITGEMQCDPHIREENSGRKGELNRAHERLLMRLLPFIYLQDQNL